MNPDGDGMVLEAYTRDVGRGVARVGSDLMAKLKISPGDIIEIKGKRTTVAKCLSGLTTKQLEAEQMQLVRLREKLYKTKIDEKTDFITRLHLSPRNDVIEMTPVPNNTVRIDGLIRNNAGVAIGDTITIRKIDSEPAEEITVAPLESIPPIDARYLADALEGIPVTKGDNIMIPYFGGRLTFSVTYIIPDAVSVVIQKTRFFIQDQGPMLRTVGDFKYYAAEKNVTLIMEDMIRKETQEDNYLILKIHLHYGGFGTIGEFQIKLEKNTVIQSLVLRYKKLAEEIVTSANKKLAASGNINSAVLIKMTLNLKFLKNGELSNF